MLLALHHGESFVNNSTLPSGMYTLKLEGRYLFFYGRN